jgi:hypothetical protein
VRFFQRRRRRRAAVDILAAMDSGVPVTWHAVDDPTPGLFQLDAPVGPRGWYSARVGDLEFCIYSEGPA